MPPPSPTTCGSLALQAAALPESTPLLAVPPCAGRPGAAAISPKGVRFTLGRPSGETISLVGPRFEVQTCDALLRAWINVADANALSPDEDARAKAITGVTRRRQFLAGRWLAKTMLCDAFGGVPADWRISADPLSKPRLAGHSAQLSIAHSGEFVACAIAQDAVGIDIERISHRRPVADMAELVCSEDEQLELCALTDEARAMGFYGHWTCKEARLKQLGLPFGIAELRGIQTTPADSTAATVGSWCFTQPGLVVSIAARGLPLLCARWPAHWRVGPVQWRRFG